MLEIRPQIAWARGDVQMDVTHVQKLGRKGKLEYGVSVTAAVKTRKAPQK